MKLIAENVAVEGVQSQVSVSPSGTYLAVLVGDSPTSITPTYIKLSHDSGTTWSVILLPSTGGYNYDDYVIAVADNGEIFLAGEGADSSYIPGMIYMSAWQYTGGTWVQHVDGPTSSDSMWHQPAWVGPIFDPHAVYFGGITGLVYNGTYLVLLWGRGSYNFYARRSGDGGAIWSSDSSVNAASTGGGAWVGITHCQFIGDYVHVTDGPYYQSSRYYRLYVPDMLWADDLVRPQPVNVLNQSPDTSSGYSFTLNSWQVGGGRAVVGDTIVTTMFLPDTVTPSISPSTGWTTMNNTTAYGFRFYISMKTVISSDFSTTWNVTYSTTASGWQAATVVMRGIDISTLIAGLESHETGGGDLSVATTDPGNGRQRIFVLQGLGTIADTFSFPTGGWGGSVMINESATDFRSTFIGGVEAPFNVQIGNLLVRRTGSCTLFGWCGTFTAPTSTIINRSGLSHGSNQTLLSKNGSTSELYLVEVGRGGEYLYLWHTTDSGSTWASVVGNENMQYYIGNYDNTYVYANTLWPCGVSMGNDDRLHFWMMPTFNYSGGSNPYISGVKTSSRGLTSTPDYDLGMTVVPPPNLAHIIDHQSSVFMYYKGLQRSDGVHDHQYLLVAHLTAGVYGDLVILEGPVGPPASGVHSKPGPEAESSKKWSASNKMQARDGRVRRVGGSR